LLPDNSLVFRKHFAVVPALDPGTNDINNRNDLEATSFLKQSELLPRSGLATISARTLMNEQRLGFEERNHEEWTKFFRAPFRARRRGRRFPGFETSG
jgi:hypothetical protein